MRANRNQAAARATYVEWESVLDQDGRAVRGEMKASLKLQKGGNAQFQWFEIDFFANSYRWEVKLNGERVSGKRVTDVDMQRRARRTGRFFRTPLAYARNCCELWLEQNGFGESVRYSSGW